MKAHLKIVECKKEILIHVNDMCFVFRKDPKNLSRYANIHKTLKTLDKLEDDYKAVIDKECYGTDTKSKKKDVLFKKALKKITNHTLGMFAYSKLYGEFKDDTFIAELVGNINNSIADILNKQI